MIKKIVLFGGLLKQISKSNKKSAHNEPIFSFIEYSQGIAVLLPAEEFIENGEKDRVILGCVRKQGHRRAELLIVGASHNRVRIVLLQYEQDLAELTQSRAEYGMLNIRPRLVKVRDAVKLRVIASPERGKLRKDIPHPMRLLSALPYFAECRGI